MCNRCHGMSMMSRAICCSSICCAFSSCFPCGQTPGPCFLCGQTLSAMGSTGWVRCYWCEQWWLNAYIPDWIGGPLCGPCMDRSIDPGRPWAPSALDHRVNVLWHVIPSLRDLELEILRLIASFLEDPWRPGAGSRWTYLPRRSTTRAGVPSSASASVPRLGP